MLILNWICKFNYSIAQQLIIAKLFVLGDAVTVISEQKHANSYKVTLKEFMSDPDISVATCARIHHFIKVIWKYI